MKSTLRNRFEQLEQEVAASNFSEIMKEEANKLAGKTKEEPVVLPTQDKKKKKSNKQTEESRKELRKKENK